MESFICNCNEHDAVEKISENIYKRISQLNKIVILCIGTDRSTGDSLGPLVGTQLSASSIYNDVEIYGTLENPVHAKNLEKTISDIKYLYPDHFIIAIDACLGSLSRVESIVIDNGTISPGEALGKGLPSVGDMSIVGVVNVSGGFEFMTTQSTRFNTVNNLAKVISESLIQAINKAFALRQIAATIITPKLLNFDTPQKLEDTKEHNSKYSSDCSIPGTYVPNMSTEWNNRWKARHIKGENERIEIKKCFSGSGGYAQVVIIVSKNNHIQISANAKIHMDFDTFNELTEAVDEAKKIMGVV